jgi:hypothetical protein
MTFFVGNLVEVEKEHRTGRRDSDGGRAYILAINNDDNDDDRGTKRSITSRSDSAGANSFGFSGIWQSDLPIVK